MAVAHGPPPFGGPLIGPAPVPGMVPLVTSARSAMPTFSGGMQRISPFQMGGSANAPPFMTSSCGYGAEPTVAPVAAPTTVIRRLNSATSLGSTLASAQIQGSAQIVERPRLSIATPPGVPASNVIFSPSRGVAASAGPSFVGSVATGSHVSHGSYISHGSHVAPGSHVTPPASGVSAAATAVHPTMSGVSGISAAAMPTPVATGISSGSAGGGSAGGLSHVPSAPAGLHTHAPQQAMYAPFGGLPSEVGMPNGLVPSEYEAGSFPPAVSSAIATPVQASTPGTAPPIIQVAHAGVGSASIEDPSRSYMEAMEKLGVSASQAQAEIDALRRSAAMQEDRIAHMYAELQAARESEAATRQNLQATHQELARVMEELRLEREAREQAEAALAAASSVAVSPTALAAASSVAAAPSAAGGAPSRPRQALSHANTFAGAGGAGAGGAGVGGSRSAARSEARAKRTQSGEATERRRLSAAVGGAPAPQVPQAPASPSAVAAAAAAYAAAAAAAEGGGPGAVIASGLSRGSGRVLGSARSQKDEVDLRLQEFLASGDCGVSFKKVNRNWYAFRRNDDTAQRSRDRTVEISLVKEKLMARFEPTTHDKGWNNGKFGPIERFCAHIAQQELE